MANTPPIDPIVVGSNNTLEIKGISSDPGTCDLEVTASKDGKPEITIGDFPNDPRGGYINTGVNLDEGTWEIARRKKTSTPPPPPGSNDKGTVVVPPPSS